jgi:hypothetical protein
MTANEWRKKAIEAAETQELTLPSGMVIRARRPGPLQFANWNRLPMLLDAMGESSAALRSTGEVVELVGYLRDLLTWCCVAPRIASGDTAADGEMRPHEIPEKDWMFIVSWAMRLREAQDLSTFRGERANDSTRSDGEDIRAAAEPAPGNNGYGAGTVCGSSSGSAPGGVEGRVGR